MAQLPNETPLKAYLLDTGLEFSPCLRCYVHTDRNGRTAWLAVYQIDDIERNHKTWWGRYQALQRTVAQNGDLETNLRSGAI